MSDERTILTPLRVYDPVECDAQGVPLDWERCSTCNGESDNDPNSPAFCPCAACDERGYGSLKAAALTYLTTLCGASDGSHDDAPRCNRRVHDDRWHADVRDGELWAGWGGGETNPFTIAARCEDCGHPMSDGTWQGPDLVSRPDLRGDQWLWDDHAWVLNRALSYLRDGREPFDGDEHAMVYWSPCDEECRHGMPFRFDVDNGRGWGIIPPEVRSDLVAGQVVGERTKVEASWRGVDVRALGWPHDLRPDKLAMLCLRCWAGTERAMLPPERPQNQPEDYVTEARSDK